MHCVKWDNFVGDRNCAAVTHSFRGLLTGFMTSVMQRMHWMQWMGDFWMEGSFVCKWLDMEDRRRHIVVIAAGGG
jgi:hypothetical protein